MRPILSPSARVSVDCPSRVGCAAVAGWIKSGFAPFFDFDLDELSPRTSDGGRFDVPVASGEVVFDAEVVVLAASFAGAAAPARVRFAEVAPAVASAGTSA